MVVSLLGIWLAYQFYIRNRERCRTGRERQGLHAFLLNKWYFDELYQLAVRAPAHWFGRFLWKGGDGIVIDGFGPNGIAARVIDQAVASRLQSGYVYHYAFAMLIGVVRC